MKKISSNKIKALNEEVKKEFPASYSLQQVHLARLIIDEKTKDLNQKELIEYYKNTAKQVKKKQLK